jgi:hypothetical protein
MRLIPIIHSKLTDCSLTTSTKYLQADLDLHWIRWLTAVPEQSWHTKLAASPGRLALTHIEFPQPKAPASFCFAFIPFRHRCKRPPDTGASYLQTQVQATSRQQSPSWKDIRLSYYLCIFGAPAHSFGIASDEVQMSCPAAFPTWEWGWIRSCRAH